MIKNLTFQYFKHLFRIRYSLFLMPIFWFAYAVSTITRTSVSNAVLVFAIIHLLIHPSTFAFNRFLSADKDKLFNADTLKITKQSTLFFLILIDVSSIILSLWVSKYFAVMIFIYIIISKLYGYFIVNKGIFNLYGFVVGGIIQGSILFLFIQEGLHVPAPLILSKTNLTFSFLCTLFILGTYPVTHLHNLNKHKDLTQQLNTKISVWSSILFSGKSFLITSKILGIILFTTHHLFYYEVYIFCMIPLILFFGFWLVKVNKSFSTIDYKSTLQLNYVSSFALSFAFILMIVLR